MTFTLAWLAGSLLLSLVFWNRPAVVLSAVAAARLLIPGIAQGQIMPLLHPAEALFLVHIAVQAAFAWPRLAAAMRTSLGVWAVTLLIMPLMFVDIFSGQSSWLSLVANIFRFLIMPAALFTLIRFELTRRPHQLMRWMGWTVFTIGVAEVAIGQQQITTGSAIFWIDYYKSFWWFNEGDLGRGMGTLGHYIQFGGFLASMVPLTLLIRSSLTRLALAFLFTYGVVISGSRVPLIFAVLGLLIVVLVTLLQSPVRTLLFAVVAGGWVATLFFSDAAQYVASRFKDGRESNTLRLEAYDWVFAHWGDFIWVGYPGARDLRGQGVLGSSLENGYVIFGMYFGLMTAAVLLILHLVLVGGAFRPRSAGWAVATVVFLGSGMNLVFNIASSAFASGGTETLLLASIAAIGWGLAARGSRTGATPGFESAGPALEFSAPSWTR